MIRATVDTNVLVSALMFPRGRPHQLLQKALAGELNLAVSQSIVAEVAEVLERKFGAPPGFIEEGPQIIGLAARTMTPAVELNVITADPDDRVVECAVSAESKFIVTGSRHVRRY